MRHPGFVGAPMSGQKKRPHRAMLEQRQAAARGKKWRGVAQH